MIMLRSLCLAAAMALGCSSGANAVVVASKPLNLAAPFQGFISESEGQQIAEDFALTGAANANQVTFYGYLGTGSTTGSFDILFFNDVSGLPTTTQFYLDNTGPVAGVFAGIDEGIDIYAWTVSIPVVTFPSAATYWISVRDTEPFDNFVWEHSFSNGDGVVVKRNGNLSPWEAVPIPEARDTQAFILENVGAVPEPATLALLGLGVAGLGFSRRKQ